ncbi:MULTISPECIES: hypothetical protein [unclassified Streptomyces]|nr:MULTISPECIES: hypothetical protein [unclassified Streptomyces]
MKRTTRLLVSFSFVATLFGGAALSTAADVSPQENHVTGITA